MTVPGDNHLRALVSMGDLDFDGAASILESEPADNLFAQNDLALCLSMLGRVPEALEILDRALAADPGNSFLVLNRYFVAEADKLRTAPKPEPMKRVREVKGEGPKHPLVTVVMPTMNRPELIRDSIQSVLKQTRDDWELIVVNDGGNREVEKTMEEFLPDGRVRYVYAEHGGLSSARNVGMALARGKYISQLDDDDVYYPEHLAAVTEVLEADPKLMVAYADCNRAFQKLQGGRWVTERTTAAYRADFDPRRLRRESFIPVISFIHRRECLGTAGLYHEGIRRAMDWEFLIRLAKHYTFQRVPRSSCEQREREGRDQMTRSFTIARNYFRNSISFLHGFFPLTGARYLDSSQGKGERLKRGLDRLMRDDAGDFFKKRLELRKLIVEPYYSLFYTLGKRLTEEGHPGKARMALRASVDVSPYEIRAWSRLLRLAGKGD